MLQKFKAWLIKQLSATETIAVPAHSTGATGQIEHETAQNLVPYDENLLERSRTQWQFGDWESLSKLERDTLQHHPDRAKLALLAASGHLQQGDSQAARQFTRLAQDWGCSKKLISQILISGVHNSLGRAAAVSGHAQRALQHFQSAIQAGAPNSEVRLLTEARLNQLLAGNHASALLAPIKLEKKNKIQEHDWPSEQQDLAEVAIQEQIDALNLEKANLIAQRSELTTRCESLQDVVRTLARARDEQARMTMDPQTEIEQLARTSEQQALVIAAKQEQIEALKLEKAKLAAERSELAARCGTLQEAVRSLSGDSNALRGAPESFNAKRADFNPPVVDTNSTSDYPVVPHPAAFNSDHLNQTRREQSATFGHRSEANRDAAMNRSASGKANDNSKSDLVEGPVNKGQKQTELATEPFVNQVSGLHEWMPSPEFHNFGDQLMWLIGENIFTQKSWAAIKSDKHSVYVLLGSALSDSVIEKLLHMDRLPVFVGCGYRGVPLAAELLRECRVIGCRGLFTQSELSRLGIKVNVVGDPAMILPVIIKPTKNNIKGKRILIPHILDPKRLQYHASDFSCDEVIQPALKDLDALHILIAEVTSAEFILAGAMHAAILAHAYDVPFAFFQHEYLDCPPKWIDWASSIGLPHPAVKYFESATTGQQWYVENKRRMRKNSLTPILRAYNQIGNIRLRVWVACALHDITMKLLSAPFIFSKHTINSRF